MQQKTYSVLRFVVNKALLIISTFFTFSLFIMLSDTLKGKIAFGGLAIFFEFCKWLIAARYKRDKGAFLKFLYGVGFTISFIATSAFALAEIDGKTSSIGKEEVRDAEEKGDLDSIKERIATLQRQIDTEQSDILAYKGDAVNEDGSPNLSAREWQKQYYRNQRQPIVDDWKEELRSLEDRYSEGKESMEGGDEEKKEDEEVDPGRAFTLLGFKVVPGWIIQVVLMVVLAVWMEIFIFVTTEPLGGEYQNVAKIVSSPPKEQMKMKGALEKYIKCVWDLQIVGADTSDEAVAKRMGLKVEDVVRLRVMLMIVGWKEGPVAEYKGRKVKLRYHPDVVRKIMSKLEGLYE